MGKLTSGISGARLKGIYRESITHDKEGWLVLVNHIPGYCTPPEIEGFIPDIYAIKGTQTLIVMVESQGDQNALRTNVFTNYAVEFENLIFKTCRVDAAGCRL
jgi:hypothetical protein